MNAEKQLRRYYRNTIAVILAAVLVPLLAWSWATVHQNHQKQRWTQVDAVVTSQPTAVAKKGGTRWEAEISYEGGAINTIVPQQAKLGETTSAWYDSVNKTLYRSASPIDSPVVNTFSVGLGVAGVSLIVLLATALGVLYSPLPRRIDDLLDERDYQQAKAR